MFKPVFLLLAAATVFTSQALTVTSTAGKLSSKIDESTDITELTVSGTMDARDFKFIADSLNELTTLNLKDVTIAAYSNSTPLFGVISDYQTQAIPRTAFFGKKLTSVTLPAGLEAIGYAAFAGCDKLTSITIPASVTTIGDYAFAGSGLQTVTLSSSVTTMGKGVFARCTSLTSAVIEAAPVGDFAFLGDTQLTSVELGEQVASIGVGAFNGCTALVSPTIPSGTEIKSIGDEAFIASGLTGLGRVSSMALNHVGDWAFAQTPLVSMQLPSSLKDLGAGAFAHDYKLQSVILPAGTGCIVPEFDDGYIKPLYLRDWDKGIPTQVDPDSARIDVSSSLEEINDYMFASDTLLAISNILGNGVTTIGNYVFYNNSQEVDTMVLPATVTYLGDRAMAGMTGMLTLNTGNSSVPDLGNEVWAGVEQSIVPLITPSDESTELYKEAEQWKEFFFASKEEVTMGDVNCDGVVDIGDVTTLIDFVLNGGDNLESFCIDAADIDGSGVIDIGDVTGLIDLVLNGSANLSVHKVRSQIRNLYNTTSDALSLDAFSMRPGQTRTVEVKLNNTEHNYSAMQSELVLPQGIRVTAIEAADSQHEFAYVQHTNDESVLTLVGFSMSLDDFAGNESAVMRLTLTADDNFDGNDTMLSFENVRLCTSKSKVYLADAAMAQVTVNTGIDPLTTADKQVASVHYYDMQGHESEAPFDGLNIVVTTFTDGTSATSKVLK